MFSAMKVIRLALSIHGPKYQYMKCQNITRIWHSQYRVTKLTFSITIVFPTIRDLHIFQLRVIAIYVVKIISFLLMCI